MISIRCHTEISDIVTLRDAWNVMAGDHFMRSFDWQFAWLENFGLRSQPCILTAWVGENLIGILPLVETYRTWTGRTLELVGSGKACSDDLSILSSDEHRTSVAKAFANWLIESPSMSWEHLDLDGVRTHDSAMNVFATMLAENHGANVYRQPEQHCWAVALPGNGATNIPWPRRFRKLTNRFQRELDQGNFVCDVAQNMQQAVEYLALIEQMHQARWEEQGIDGCFATPSFRSFVSSAIQRLWNEKLHGVPNTCESPSSQVYVSILSIDHEPAAGQIAFRAGASFAVYLTGMSPRFGEHRPGYKLHWFNAQLANQIGCTSYDLLRGDEEYKSRMGGQPSAQERWMISAPRWNAKMRMAVYQQARRWRGLVRSSNSIALVSSTAVEDE